LIISIEIAVHILPSKRNSLVGFFCTYLHRTRESKPE